jgi:hypothetical protein
VLLTSTVMAASVPAGSVISVWNPAINNYNIYLKNNRGAWVGDALTAVLQPGQGLVINSTSTLGQTWYETKPYTWP